MITAAIHHWAARTPERTAVEYNGRAVTYGAYAALIDEAARRLAGRGVSGAGIAILAVYNMMDFWCLSLALRRLGLHVIAMRPTESPQALAMPGVRAVVTSAVESWPGLAEACAAQGWPLETFPGDPGDAAPATPARRHGGQILQSSGTTGAFKKVLMDPAWEEGFIRRRARLFGVTPETVHCLFDFGGWTGAGYKSAAAAWLMGGAVRLTQDQALHHALARPGCTHATVIPQKLQALLAAPADALMANPAMRLFITGGAITQAMLDETRARVTPHVVASLGATESLTFAHTPLITAEDRRWHRPCADASVQVVDDDDRPLAAGALGRVRVTAAGGPRGYLFDEAGTRAFFKDGFFYPGDLGVLRADGRLALHGRATDVINVEGNKIAPAPIEEAIRDALGVSAVVILTLQAPNGDEEAHVVIESSAPVDLDRLAAAVRGELFGFDQAQAHFIPALPRNENGKVLRPAVLAWLRRGG